MGLRNGRKNETRLSVARFAYKNSKAAKRAACSKSVFVRHIVSDEDRDRSFKQFMLHECANGGAFVGTFVDKLHDAFASLEREVMFSCNAISEFMGGMARLRILAVVQRSAMGLGLIAQMVFFSERLQVCNCRSRQRLRHRTQI